MSSTELLGFDINAKIQRLEGSLSIDCAENLPIELYVVAQLPSGVGDIVIRDGLKRQYEHPNFVEEYNVLSAKIVDIDLSRGNQTAIYTFGIERDLIPHRHTGQRAITAISGSSGLRLVFSSARPEEVKQNHQAILEKISVVEIPADVIFILRFYGGTWHYFCSNSDNVGLFAVTVHVDEFEGLSQDDDLWKRVRSGQSSIPLLTECVSPAVDALLKAHSVIK